MSVCVKLKYAFSKFNFLNGITGIKQLFRDTLIIYVVAASLAYSYCNSAIFARKTAESLPNRNSCDSRTLFLHMC